MPPELQPEITLSHALSDTSLLGGPFRSATYWTWKVVAKLIDGLPLTEPREIELFELCTGRRYNRQARSAVRRLLLLCGRRGGKDRFLLAVAVWRAALCQDWNKFISVGEQAVVLLLGADRKQAAILRRYCQGLLQTPLLAEQVTRTTGAIVEFRNGGALEIATNDARLVRGRSAVAVLGSEGCYWKTDEFAASSDEEVVGAAEPSMAMCPDGGLLLLGSSVYLKRGYMYRKYRELYANNDAEDICWFATSQTMNPKLPQSVIDKAMAENPNKAGAEFLNRWREDITDFIPLDDVEKCTDRGIFERPPIRGVNYVAFCDAAGGLGSDSFTLAIGHRDYATNKVVLDAVREHKPKFIPRDVIHEYAELLKSYKVFTVMGDGYGGGFHADEWRQNRVTFQPCEKTTSENYLFFLPMLLSERCRLLDSATARSQICSLEHHTQPSGREKVDHPQHANAHDDVSCAIAGCMVAAGDRLAFNQNYSQWSGGSLNDGEAWLRLRRTLYYESGGAFLF